MRALLILLSILSGLVGIAVVAVGIALLNARDEPVSLGFLAGEAEAMAASALAPLNVTVDDLALGWRDERPVLLARGLVLGDAADGFTLALPEARIAPDWGSLIDGQLELAGLDLIGLTVALTQDAAGRLSAGAAPDDGVAGDGVAGDDVAGDDGMAAGEVIALVRVLTGSDGGDAPALIARGGAIVLDDARLLVRDAAGSMVAALPFRARLNRTPQGQPHAVIAIATRGDLANPSIRLDAILGRDDDIAFDASLTELQPADLVPLDSRLSALGRVVAPVSGLASASVAQGRLRDAHLTAEVAAGQIDLQGLVDGDAVPAIRQSISIDGLSLAVAHRPATAIDAPDVTTIEALEIAFPQGRIAGRGRLESRDGLLRVFVSATEIGDRVARALLADDILPAGVAIDGAVDAALLFGTTGLERWRLEASAAGSIDMPDLFETTVSLDSLIVSAMSDGPAGLPWVPRFDLAVDGIDLSLSATTEPVAADGSRAGNVEILFDRIPAAAVQRLWPNGVLPSPRAWVRRNISTGLVRDGRAVLDIRLAADGALDIVPTAEFRAVDVAVRYWDAMPPARDAAARARFEGNTFALDIEGARQGPLRVTGGRIVFDRLGLDPEAASIDVTVDAPLAGLLAELDRPPLNAARFLGVDPAGASGEVSGRLSLDFPPSDGVTFDDMVFSASLDGRDVLLPGVIFGHDLRRGTLAATLDKETLGILGDATVEGARLSLDVRLPFESNGPPARYTVSGPLDEAARRAFAVDNLLGDAVSVSGPVGLSLRGTGDPGGQARIAVELDLTPATIRAPVIGYAKAARGAGASSFTLALADGAVVGVEDIIVTAAELAVAAHVQIAAHPVRGPGKGDVLVDLRRVASGSRIDVSGRIVQASDGLPMTIEVGGPAFDLRPVLDWVGGLSGAVAESEAPGDAQGEASGEARQVQVRVLPQIDRLHIGPSIVLAGVRGQLDIDGGELARVNLEAPGSGGLALALSPRGGGWSARVTADDAGAATAAFGLSDRIAGGTLLLTADAPGGLGGLDRGQPVTGDLRIDDFRARRAPLLGRLLTLASITGPLGLLTSGDGLSFIRAETPFTYSGDALTLPGGRVFGAALGVTFRGQLDLDAGTLDLAGSIVPAYSINRVLGAIPLIGTLLTGGEGEGLFAATYRATGRLEEPEVAVNALSALAPGFLRGLFSGEGTKPGEPGFDPSEDPSLRDER